MGKKMAGQKDGGHFLPCHLFASELLVFKTLCRRRIRIEPGAQSFSEPLQESRPDVSRIQHIAA
jgi:hypothetical protein